MEENQKIIIILFGCPYSGKSTTIRKLKEIYKDDIAVLDDENLLKENWNNRQRFMLEYFKKENKLLSCFDCFFLESQNLNLYSENDLLIKAFSEIFKDSLIKFMILMLPSEKEILYNRYKKEPRDNWLPRKFGIDYEIFFENSEFPTSISDEYSKIFLNNAYFYFFKNNIDELKNEIQYLIDNSIKKLENDFDTYKKEIQTKNLKKQVLSKFTEKENFVFAKEISNKIDDFSDSNLNLIKQHLHNFDKKTQEKIVELYKTKSY